MAKTRADLRNLVRAQLDMDDEELPNSTLDLWLDDAYDQTIALSDRWPFFEDSWTLTTVASQVPYTFASLAAGHASTYELRAIASVNDLTTAGSMKRLQQLGHDHAEACFGDGGVGTSVPAYYSTWGDKLHIWPSPLGSRALTVRGFRKGAWGAGDAAVVDADDRLHIPLAYFAMGMAYGQQEDEILKADWMRQWGAAVQRAHTAIMAPAQDRPLVLSGGLGVALPSPVRLSVT